MAKVENLYGGDMRLDTLEEAITDCGQDIPIASIVGIVEKIKLKLLKQMSEDDEL